MLKKISAVMSMCIIFTSVGAFHGGSDESDCKQRTIDFINAVGAAHYAKILSGVRIPSHVTGQDRRLGFLDVNQSMSLQTLRQIEAALNNRFV